MIQRDLSELRNCPIDLHEIEMSVRDFYIKIDYEPGDSLSEIFEAKNILIDLRTTIFSLINPDDNDYIKSYPNAYKWLSENLSRIDRYLDELEKETIGKPEFSRMLRAKYVDEYDNSYIIVNYTRKLDTLMKHLVYYPLKKAYLRFKKDFLVEKDEKKQNALKDEKLFHYFVFFELHKSAQVLGNEMYERKKTPSSQQQPYEPPSEKEIPPSTPKDVKVNDLTEKKFEENFEELFENDESI